MYLIVSSTTFRLGREKAIPGIVFLYIQLLRACISIVDNITNLCSDIEKINRKVT